MPHIFPKRRLRTRDVLDPEDLNADFSPAQELADGQIDATNFDASDMKTNVTVAQGAYYIPYYASVECDLSFGGAGLDKTVLTPNFVEEDGDTFRTHYPTDDGTLTPFIVPNNGGWVAVDNGTNAGPALTVEPETGTSVLWLTGYVQYVWQGFHEPSEANALGVDPFDPTKHDKNKWPTDDTPYGYPLFEASVAREKDYPGLGGWHHRSRGGHPANVQFALRVDGRIITSTITGTYDESEAFALGVQSGFDKAQSKAARAQAKRVSFEAWEAIPGQKLPWFAAAAPGPEVMALRFGAAVPVSPGAHVVEIVARRLPAHEFKTRTHGDYIGVFTRRLLCLDLPNTPPVTDGRSTLETIPDFTTEMLLNHDTLHTQTAELLRDRFNTVDSADVLRHSLPNTHLPSKVAYMKRASIIPEINADDGGIGWSRGWSNARWPGWPGGTTTHSPTLVNGSNHVVTSRTAGWKQPFADATNGAGWFQLDDAKSTGTITKLEIDETGTSNLHLTTDDILIVQADVFLRAIYPEKSEFMKSLDPSFWTYWDEGLNFDQPHKYLDLFSAFAIGYHDGSDWTIVKDFRPAWVNHYNWFGRSPWYMCDSVSGERVKIDLHPGGFEGKTEADVAAREDPYTGSMGPPGRIDLRARQTSNLWQFCNVPLFFVIQGRNLDIKKLGVFCSSTAPGFHQADTSDVETRYSTPRDAIGMVRTYWGRSSLMALKLKK